MVLIVIKILKLYGCKDNKNNHTITKKCSKFLVSDKKIKPSQQKRGQTFRQNSSVNLIRYWPQEVLVL
jgi:hypothetical protein